MTKRVLIITYYWPPAGGAGVQRWLKFVKYLPQFGWEPVVYTAQDGEYPVLDHSLEKEVPEGTEVIRKKIIEPYSWYKKFIGQKPEEKINAGFLSQSEKPAGKEKLARWIRGNLFIPDARRFWIRPSVRFLSKYLKDHPVDIMVSTGPPHSMHLIALGIKKKLDIPWIADFRDPWTKIDFYKELHLSRWADRKHHLLEKKSVQTADMIVAVTRHMQKDFEKLGARQPVYLPNGFDPEDIPAEYPVPEKGDKFRIVYVGTLNRPRNPEILWETVAEMIEEDPLFATDLEIDLVGKTDIIVDKAIKQYRLSSYVNKKDYLPHHEIFGIQKEAAVLLLLINRAPDARGIVTGKIFEYLTAGRPILALGPPDGEAAMILNQTGTGTTVDYDDKKRLKKVITEFYHLHKAGKLFVTPEHIENFSRVNLTKQLVGLFEKAVGQKSGDKNVGP